MVEMDHKKTYTNVMVETGHKYIKDLVWKNVFESGFHFHIVSIFALFQLDFSFNFKLPKWSRWVLRGDSLPWTGRAMKTSKLKFSCLMLWLNSRAWWEQFSSLWWTTISIVFKCLCPTHLWMVHYLSVLRSILL